MTKQSKKIAVYLLLLIAGLFILFKFYWTQDLNRWFGLAGLVLSSYCLIKLIIEITNLFYPSTKGFELSILLNKEKYENFKGQSSEANKQTWTFLISVILIFVIGVYTFYNFTKSYKLNQLTNFGQTQKVIIKDIHKLGKGSTFSFFDLSFNNKKVDRHLYKKEGQNIGDTCIIIFSTDNTDIIEWADVTIKK